MTPSSFARTVGCTLAVAVTACGATDDDIQSGSGGASHSSTGGALGSGGEGTGASGSETGGTGSGGTGSGGTDSGAGAASGTGAASGSGAASGAGGDGTGASGSGGTDGSGGELGSGSSPGAGGFVGECHSFGVGGDVGSGGSGVQGDEVICDSKGLYDESDIADISDCTIIDGNLVTGSNLASFDGLESIREVRGMINVSSDALQSVAGLRNLEVAGSIYFHRGDPSLTILEFPALRDVLGDFLVGDETFFEHLQAPELRVVEDTLDLEAHPTLKTVDLRSLETVGTVRVIDNPSLLSLGGLPSLDMWANFVVLDNPLLPTCEMLFITDHASVAHGISIRNNSETPCCSD